MPRQVHAVPVVLFAIAAVLAGCSKTSSVPASELTPSTLAAGPAATSSTIGGVPATTVPQSCSSVSDIGKWTSAQLAAQMLVTSVNDANVSEISPAVAQGVGGVILMGNTPSPNLGSEIASLNSKAPNGLQPLIMTDEEGGGIQRLSSLVGTMPWPRVMAETMSPAAVEQMAFKVGTEMKRIGVSVDLAPVVDLDSRPGPSNTNPDGRRSFSSDPKVVAAYARAFSNGLEKAGVVPVLKHFPGLGGASGNTDVMSAKTVPYSQLLTSGLVPFRTLAPLAKAVMVSNASVPGLSNGVPSSLSPRVVSILRKAVGFSGVVMSDSLETVSISNYQADINQAVVEAAVAGIDLIVLASSSSDQIPIFTSALTALTASISNGSFPRSLAETSVGRILVLKGVSTSCIYY